MKNTIFLTTIKDTDHFPEPEYYFYRDGGKARSEDYEDSVFQ